MDFEGAVATINRVLLCKQPTKINSSWILKHAPRCYRFIQKTVRAELGGIDCDKVTYALDREYQRRWAPDRRRKPKLLYENRAEIDLILDKYQDILYVFIAPGGALDRRLFKWLPGL